MDLCLVVQDPTLKCFVNLISQLVSLEQCKNHQQIQPTCDAGSRIQTWVVLVGDALTAVPVLLPIST